jgi:alpha-galactosidase
MMGHRITLGIAAASILILSIAGVAHGAPGAPGGRIVNEGGKIKVEFDENLKSRIIANLDKDIVLGQFTNSEFVTANGKDITEFRLTGYAARDWRDSLGVGKEYEITGVSGHLQKTVSMVCYDDFPTMLMFTVAYRNTGAEEIAISGWTNNQYSVTALHGATGVPPLWSYQPGSYGWDNNWIIPLDSGYTRDNYLGMTSVDYGGGTPVADIWRPDCGVAVGHVELVPKLVSMPVRMVNAREATLGITYSKNIALKPGTTVSTLRTFVEVHNGDHYNSLVQYRQFMERQGLRFKDAPECAYQTEWCGWGYEQNFTMEEIYNTLPKVKDLGLEWVVLDMGWYKGLGDYALPSDKFPNGDEDMKRFVDKVHSYGMKVQLWWMPLAVTLKTELMAKHPEYLLLNEDGSPRFMPSFFKSFFLCPATNDIREYSRQQVIRFMRWGFDGLKIDGNNQNCVPSCFNPDHKHIRPEESVEQLPAFYKMVYETALDVNPKAKIEICPCGTNQSFFLMPYMNETVASDPHNSWQVRLKGKTLKALTGSKSVFYGDHVELSDERSDFASTIGVGGVIGTKFVYPPGVHMNTESGDVSLTPEKETEWRKWISISKAHPLSRGLYRGELYDIGFDRPETHAIQVHETMYYAFFAPTYNGSVEFRGLKNREYRIIDYERNVALGTIKGPVATLNVSFKKHLLVKTEPR